MKSSFVKKKINGVSWCIASEFLSQDSDSSKRLLNKLNGLKDVISSFDYSGFNVTTYPGSIQESQFDTKKAFMPIKAGRRKLFGLMNIIDKGGEYDAYVKIYNCPSLLLKLKHIFIPSKAEREFALSFRLNECGIPGVSSIANGHEKSMGILKRSYLIIKKIDNTVNLQEFFCNPDLPAKEKHIVIERFGEVAGLSHQHGILQTDFALNNFLAQRIGNEDYRVYLIDYERMKISKKLTNKMKFRTLAKLNRVGGDFSTTDKLRFLRSYFNCNKADYSHNRTMNINPVPEIRQCIHSIDSETNRILKKSAWNEWKGCVKGERKFKKYNDKNIRGHHLKNYNADTLINMINGFDGFKAEKEIVFHDSVKITSVVTTLPDNDNVECVTIYKTDGIDAGFPYTFWQNSNALLKGRFKVFKPIGVFVKGSGSLNTTTGSSGSHSVRYGYLIMSHSASLQDLNGFFRNIDIAPERKAFLSKLTRFVCRMHNFGNFVSNINPGDIVVNKKSNGYDLYFAHTFNFKFNSSLSHKEREADIERLVFCFSDSLKNDERIYFKKMYAKNEEWASYKN
ncbi:MAG: lipopolysaccharide kinase InaA family protein [Candidatus Anammoxibacter sp.]